jgi:peroxiredoxin Q/BCP
MPEQGRQFPEVRFTTKEREALATRDLEGQKTFSTSTKDDSPGCTKEACAFRGRMDDYRPQGLRVFGVSLDHAESHRRFRESTG